MTLADALDYAAEFKPKAVIDLATLTGACVTALGQNVAAGYFANDEFLADKVAEASKASDEKLWRLPLYTEYRDKIKTDYADIKNSGGAGSGVGSSAVLRQEFTSYPWAHRDIAGMVWKISVHRLLPAHTSTACYPRCDRFRREGAGEFREAVEVMNSKVES